VLFSKLPEQIHWPTLSMGAGTLLLLIGLKVFAPKLPGMIFAMAGACLLSWLIDYEQLGGKVVGEIPDGLPSFSLPSIDQMHFSELLFPALLVALLSFVEAFSIAKAVASRTRQRLSADQEMIGKGLANLTAGVMNGYPVSGSFSRTAVAFEAGAKTGFAAIVSGALVGLTLLFFTPLLGPLPISSLAAVIIMSVTSLLRPIMIWRALQVSWHDGIVAAVVFFSTLWLAPHLEMGIFIGVGLSIGFYLYYTMRPAFAEVARYHDGSFKDSEIFELHTSDQVAVYRYDGDLYFANASYLEKSILNAIADKPELVVIVLDLEAVAHIDATGEEMLSHLSERIRSAGIDIYIARTKYAVQTVLKRSGLYQRIGSEFFVNTRTMAIDAIVERYGDKVDVTPLREHKPIHSDGRKPVG